MSQLSSPESRGCATSPLPTTALIASLRVLAHDSAHNQCDKSLGCSRPTVAVLRKSNQMNTISAG